MRVRVVICELSNPAEVGLNGALAEPFEVDKTGVILIPLVGSDDVMLLVFLT